MKAQHATGCVHDDSPRQVGKRFPLDGIDVRAVAAANGPEGLVALSGRQGLWLASPEDSSGERCLTRAISKDTAGKWLDLGSDPGAKGPAVLGKIAYPPPIERRPPLPG